ncbi:MAG: permease [Bacteroidales bacterium]|nr:permease [Bacteroidales bacterium]
MKYIQLFIEKLYFLVLDMAPWLLLGFFIAGLLHVAFPQGKISALLGKSNLKSVVRAALIGIPLPLCSCGVIPTGVSIHRNGASKGAAISFLISTPQTGVDSIMVTYSLLGLPFAIVRPIVALVTGVFGGVMTNRIEGPAPEAVSEETLVTESTKKLKNPVLEIFRYAFVEFLEDIAKWLVIGLFVAALIAVFVPDDFFATYIKNDFLGMLIILVASIPIYVCATSSVPIAAVLMMKGISPGAALVFLMAGPATNAATISVIGNSMGRKTLFTYLGTLIAGALLSGLFIDFFLPAEWFTTMSSHMAEGHEHGLLPFWLQLSSGIAITLFLVNIFLRKLIKRLKRNRKNKTEVYTMGDFKIRVSGMTCNHCKMTVENNLKKIEGIKTIHADPDTGLVVFEGDHVDLKLVQETVEGLGYKYGGEAN